MGLNNKDQANGWSAVSLAWELGYTIALPLIVLALGGRLLDKKIDTSPWMMLIGILVALIVSGTAVYWKTVKIISQEAQNSNVKTQNHSLKPKNWINLSFEF
mgnify:CR=1 FL=1